MFGFIKKVFIAAMVFVGCVALKCVSMKIQECNKRSAMVNTISNVPLFYPYSVLVNKYYYTKVMILINHTLNYAFLMLLKTRILMYLICCQRLVKRVMCLGMKLVLVNED